jgi:DNA primase catalytic core
MSNITEWIKQELYPTLFESIDTALPEFNFKRFSGGWRSSLKIDLSKPKQSRADKTVVSKNSVGYILEQGGEVVGLVDYVMRRDRVEFIQAVKTLADVVGLEIPKGDLSPENYQKYKDQTTILEDCNSYFIYCLENSTGADEVRGYLSSRGYSVEDVKAMELGYIPEQDKLFKHLLKRYSQSLIDEVVTIKTDTRIGSTHRLTIPYRSGGSIKGFKFRTTGDTTPKYLNSKGLDRIGGFFNLLGIKGDKDVVIVEGELDSLSATARGVENVVATGGSSISLDQIKDAIKRGAKSFTLCLDNEPDKKQETAKRLNSSIELILGEGVNRVYIVTLPDLGGGKTDPDRLIKESGVEAFREAIRGALSYYEYKLQETLNKYGKIEEERGLQPKDIDSLLDEVIETASQILDATDRDRYKKLFTSLEAIKELGITEESLSITVDRLTSTRDKEAQSKEFKKLLSEATQLQDKGETDKALELLDSKVKEVKLKDKATEFSSLIIPIKEDELKQRQINKPESLNSGYTIGGEPLLLPSGAISVFTAPTSHGKTTFLINMALNVAKIYPDTETYLFSYEEDADSILINTLNTYLDEDLSSNNRRTLKSYFTTGSTEYIKSQSKDYFTANKDKFFKELIDNRRLNIHYSSYNSDTLIEAIRYLHKNANPVAIFIDYIQLLNLPEGKYKTYSRQEEIKEICIALKDVAVETGLPIILGAQFNREVINQLKIHPTKIGEAGDIERIANLIIGFWNNNFKPLATEGELNEITNKGASTPDTLYTTILKNRGGKVGLEEILSFNGNTGKIKNSSSSGDSYFKQTK